MNKFLSATLLLVLFFAGCERSKVEILQQRLDAFRRILPDQVREEFDSKNYEKVVAGIDSLLQHDSVFEREYRRLKDQELINQFSTQEVVDFFRIYFVDEIETLGGEKEKKW